MRLVIGGFALLVASLVGRSNAGAQVAVLPGASAPVGTSSFSGQPPLASLAALRAGTGQPDAAARTSMLAPDTIATGAGSARRRLAHSAIGAGAGLVVGAGVGALIGYGMDRGSHGDAMIPASLAVGAIGGAIGLVTGAVAGALVR